MQTTQPLQRLAEGAALPLGNFYSLLIISHQIHQDLGRKTCFLSRTKTFLILRHLCSKTNALSFPFCGTPSWIAQCGKGSCVALVVAWTWNHPVQEQERLDPRAGSSSAALQPVSRASYPTRVFSKATHRSPTINQSLASNCGHRLYGVHQKLLLVKGASETPCLCLLEGGRPKDGGPEEEGSRLLHPRPPLRG